MGIDHGPKVIRKAVDGKGLICYVDARRSASYNGSGSTWTDLSGEGNHWTLYNSPNHVTRASGDSYGSAFAGITEMSFNRYYHPSSGQVERPDSGSRHYAKLDLDMRSDDFTIIQCSRFNGAYNSGYARGGRLVGWQSTSEKWRLGDQYNRTGYASGLYSYVHDAGHVTNYDIQIGVWGFSSGDFRYYFNSRKYADNTTTTLSQSDMPTTLSIGGYNGTDGSAGGDVSVCFLMIYSRALSERECFKNYIAHRKQIPTITQIVSTAYTAREFEDYT